MKRLKVKDLVEGSFYAATWDTNWDRKWMIFIMPEKLGDVTHCINREDEYEYATCFKSATNDNNTYRVATAEETADLINRIPNFKNSYKEKMETKNKYAEFIKDAVNNKKYGMCNVAKSQIERDLPELFENDFKIFDVVKITEPGYMYTTHSQVKNWVDTLNSGEPPKYMLEYNRFGGATPASEKDIYIIVGDIFCNHANKTIYIIKSLNNNTRQVIAISGQGIKPYAIHAQ